MFWDPVGLSNELSYEAGNFSRCRNPHRCFQSEVLGFISLNWNPGLLGLYRSPVVPPGLSAHKCGTDQSAIRCLAGSTSRRLATSPLLLVACLCFSYWSRWMFLLNSLVVRLSYSWIFCEPSLLFVFKLLFSFFWLCEEVQCVCLCLHLGQKSSFWNFKKRAGRPPNSLSVSD